MSKNHLSQSANPYLLQHAQNPVWWHSWGAHAFELAAQQQKLIFLSIGYSTCHWCHVMEHESFESTEIAALMNASYISIKVDREEHPDVDHLYMEALHVMGARGGWPLNMFLTPDRKPFYGGTYFPKENFAQLLTRMSDLWTGRHQDVLNSAEKLASHLQLLQQAAAEEAVPLEHSVSRALHDLRMNEDLVYGGFSEAPKFPPNFQIGLLRRAITWLKAVKVEPTTRESLNEMLSYQTEFQTAETRVLTAMTGAGLFDHLEGGFFRYAVDREWSIPHFEKMLYNQALNLTSLLESHDLHFKPYIEKTISYLKLRLRSPDGAFFAAEDADSAEKPEEKVEEGIFYVWKDEELKAELSASAYLELAEFFEISAEGNFEEHTIHLRLRQSETRKALTTSLKDSLNILKNLRAKRLRPFRDEKVMASWNGLLITAFARAAAYGYAAESLAVTAAESIWKNLWKAGEMGVFHLYRRAIGPDIQFTGTLEDYVFLIQGYLEVYTLTLTPHWYERARKLQDQQDELFWDKQAGGYFLSAESSVDIPVRTKDFTDQATPNANAVSYSNLMLQFRLSGNPEYRDRANLIWKTAQAGFRRYPLAQSYFLSVALEHERMAEEWVVVAETGAKAACLRERFAPLQRPGRLILIQTHPSESEKITIGTQGLPQLALLIGKTEVNKIYICQNFSCQLPVSISEFLQK